MRFKKGGKVEVLSEGELGKGAWRPAEIIFGNGRHYSVRYYKPLGDRDGAAVERVPRKAIRPCPPARGEIWAVGDMVEVFDDNLWKFSKVLRPLDGSYFLVRFLGSTLETKVLKSHIRVQQSWQDDQWVVIGRNSRSCEDKEPDELQTQKYILKTNCELPKQDVNSKSHTGNDHFMMKHTISLQGCERASSRSNKRRSEFCSLHIETQMEAGGKRRATEKDGGSQQLVSQCPSQLHEKVESCIHASLTKELNVGERDFSPTHHSTGGPSLHSDGPEASSIGREYGTRCPSLSEEKCAAKLHKSELLTYRSIMEELYANGPLDWKQEVMITDLRLSLHISNDEHLLEIRHLLSA